MVRFARKDDLLRVNEIMNDVNDMHVQSRPTPYSCGRNYCEINELGVDKNFQRQGIAKELLSCIKREAKQRGIYRIELNVWEFNKDAIEFYEKMGFTTYRRYMELNNADE